ncbi:MAG: hypothetical protein AAB372_00585 [Patescibacteria group bacterium]
MKAKKRGEELNIKEYIPLDKSWMMRVGVLDIVNGYSDIEIFLEVQNNLSDDLEALLRAARAWHTDEAIDVGESGTLYRFLQFASWHFGFNKVFIKQGTLKDRPITNDAGIISYSLSKLLELDHGTSQWASAALLCGRDEVIKNSSFKLKLTYEAVSHWRERRAKGMTWELRYDETILRQAETFIALMRGEQPEFVPHQAEDYCFARAFGYITQKEGKERWPNLEGHESNRIEVMEVELENFEAGKPITSWDHRVVQALAMKGKVEKKEVQFEHPEAVTKSWPQFWGLLGEILS